MGISDRWKDWDDSPPQGGARLATPRLAGAVKTLITANVIVFLLRWLGTLGASNVETARGWVDSTFGLFPSAWDSWLFPIWQPISYGFIHHGLFHLCFNMLLLYAYGSMLENTLGSRRFYVAYFCGLLFGAVLHCLVFVLGFVPPNTAVVGASGAVHCVVIAAATLWPNRTVMFFVPLSLKVIAIGLVVYDVYMVIEGGSKIAHWAHLGGAGFGFLAARRGWLMIDPIAALSARGAARAEKRRGADEEVVDTLLEKISREGITALSEKEKDALKRASERRKA